MTTQTTPRKKGGIWFFILPVLLIGALVISKNIIFKNGQLLQNLSTKFTPEELINLTENYDIYKISYSCISKDFIQFKGYGGYKYTFIKPSKKLPDEDKNNEAKCRKYESEIIYFWSNEKSIEYLIKNEYNYESFLKELLKFQGVATYSGEKFHEYRNRPHYIKNNIVIIPEDYDIDSMDFGLFFISTDEIASQNRKFIQDSIEQKQIEIKKLIDPITEFLSDSTGKYRNMAIVKVNISPIYSKPDENNLNIFCNAPKGYKMKI